MYRIEKDSFNSQVFGIKMGNVIIEGTIDVEKILIEAKENQYRHLSIKINCDEIEKSNEFLKNGFYLVDTLVSYKYDYKNHDLKEYRYSEDIQILPVESEDFETVTQIAYDSFSNDRFHNDLNLDAKKCNKYYEQWMRNSCNGYADIILGGKDSGNNILGFCTGNYVDENVSSIVLNAVTSHSRGKGVYTALVYEVLQYFKDKSKYITVGTQVNNYAAQKAWVKLGFKIYESKYVMHYYIGNQ